ncbi:hypothetical protein BKA64DRAFT_766914 [Cadophora sp. MPI-SDFR-AT-0126]|nr:hypothetical protein BKA64DRAFT_766914 [Leotiomycetes sp. MPI-SDFR-AT-0126]
MGVATKDSDSDRNSIRSPRNAMTRISGGDSSKGVRGNSGREGNSVQSSHIDTTIIEAEISDSEASAETSKSDTKKSSIAKSKVGKIVATALSICFRRRNKTIPKSFSDLPDELKLMIIQFALPPTYKAAYEDYGRWKRTTISILKVNHMFRHEALRIANLPLHHTGFLISGLLDASYSFVSYPGPESRISDSRIYSAIMPQWILEVGEWDIPAMVPTNSVLYVLYVFPTFKAKAISRLAQFCLGGIKIVLLDAPVLWDNSRSKIWYIAREGPFFNGEEKVAQTLRDDLGKLECLHGSPLLENIEPGRGSRVPRGRHKGRLAHAERYCHNFIWRHLKGPST